MLDTSSLKHFEANNFIYLNPKGSDLFLTSCIYIYIYMHCLDYRAILG